MYELLLVAGVAIAVVAVTMPLAAVIIVSIASRREEAAQSFSRNAPGPIARAARRLLDFRNHRPVPRGIAPGPAFRPLHEVRFDHARRPLPDASKFATSNQSEPGSIRLDERERAAV